MSGLGFTIKKDDNIDSIINRIILVFVVHYALIHQKDAVDITNPVPDVLWRFFLVLLLYYVEIEVAKITDPGLSILRDILTILLTGYQTFLHYMLIAATDAILAGVTTDGPFSFVLLSRPLVLMTILAGLIGLTKHYFGKKKKDES